MASITSGTAPVTDYATYPAARRQSQLACRMLHLGFAALPIIAGADKFFHMLVDWNQYLAPSIARMLPMDAGTFMLIVGGIEIAAGLLVAFWPRVGGCVVALWLWGIIVNLLMVPGYYDVALRDVGLSLGALALSLLSTREVRGSLR